MHPNAATKTRQSLVIEDIEERSVYDVEYFLTEENGASPTLLQLLKVLVVSKEGM
jgi:hypothetical protein